MITEIIKRDGRIEKFNMEKIEIAINKACNDGMIELKNRKGFFEDVQEMVNNSDIERMPIEYIHRLVIDVLRKNDEYEVANNYQYYREERNKIRDKKSNIMSTIKALGEETDRDNGNVGNNFSAKLLRIASEANKWCMLAQMDKEMAKHHETGDYHIHDLDSFNLTINCLHVPTKKLLMEGFNTGYGTLNRPKRIDSAAMLSCIILQSSQNDMFGGQSHPNFDNDMGPFVEITREYERKIYRDKGLEPNEDDVEYRTKIRVEQAMQSIVCNLNTMHSRAGSQVPFSSINLGIPQGTEKEQSDAALICECFLKAYMTGMGKNEACIFPNIIFRVKDGVNKKPEDPYYYLFELACESASKRMNPTFCNIDASFNLPFYEKNIITAIMGCRTRTMENINGEATPIGRGNIAPVTMNLVKLSIRAGRGNINKFFKLLDELLVESEKNLLYRYDTLKKLKVKDLPFVAGQHLMMGSEGLENNDSIEPILKQGTWAIGFLGLAECLTMLTGHHHGETEEAKELGLKIVKHIREFTDSLKEKHHLNFSCYASPAEGLSGRFPKIDRLKYGVIEGVTDKDYYTNSFHIPVGTNISITDKIEIEAPYHKLCNGGHITYIELDNYPTGKQIESIVSKSFTHTDMDYMGINFHIRYCRNCQEYLNEDEDECPVCGSTSIQGISRITGYLVLDDRFGEGKKAERADRVSHTSGNLVYYSISKGGKNEK